MKAEEYEQLLDEYRRIWNNRRLGSAQTPAETLKGAIVRDLKDENTHPRARKSLKDKYYLATKRIIESSLSTDSKVMLIRLHLEIADAIQRDDAK
ncbi:MULTISPECIES: hypothetical protein [Mesobacillus]|uniref:YojE n=2 Tax=Mesobacillus TaxID=2675231 RepID=A0A0D6ZAE6_9BACI|nr:MULTISPECIES: hypothetical protein [Mesobacillus]KIY21568.1 hypothetical protein UB32_13040 [Mesobacillus subterraneus]MDQ0411972.1 hypothetical protein [Mesobacillus stamsii]